MKVTRIALLISMFFMITLLWINSPLASNISFSFNTYDGKKYSLSDFKGKYVLLNLFSSYCPPCMVELKVLQKLNENCSNKGLQVVSLMIDREGVQLLPKIVSSRNLTYPVGLANQEVFKTFPDFSITPTTYLLDPSGNRIEKFVGYMSYKEWINVLNRFVKCN